MTLPEINAHRKGMYMHPEIGTVYEGSVKGITQYGAFVEISLPDENGTSQTVTGMVHISEISNTFVRDIRDFLHEQDTVRVKVIAQTPEGKLSLSIKQAQEENKGGRPQKKRENPKPRIYEPKRSVPQSEMSFEDKLLHFKQASEEKICDLRRGSERRGGSRSRRS